MGYEWSQCWHRLRRIIQPNLLALSFLTCFVCHCLFDSPYIFIFFFWIIWKWNYPLLLKFAVVRLNVPHFNYCDLLPRSLSFSFSYWYCSLSNQLWLQTSLRTPTSFDFMKCPPYNLRQGRPFTALDGYSFRLPPSHQSTPHSDQTVLCPPPSGWISRVGRKWSTHFYGDLRSQRFTRPLSPVCWSL